MKFKFDQSTRGGGLDDLAKKVSDLTPAMKSVATVGEVQTEERFATETDPQGNPWKDSERKKAKGGKTLTELGHLGDSVSSRYGADFAEWGVGMNYGAPHQDGSEAEVSVSEHTKTISQAFGVALPEPKTVTVKAHKRKMNLPERAFLARNADELDTDLIAEAFKVYLLS